MKNCQCCEQEIKQAMSNQKYCTNCAITNRTLKTTLTYQKRIIKQLKTQLYGRTDRRTPNIKKIKEKTKKEE